MHWCATHQHRDECPKTGLEKATPQVVGQTNTAFFSQVLYYMAGGFQGPGQSSQLAASMGDQPWQQQGVLGHGGKVHVLYCERAPDHRGRRNAAELRRESSSHLLQPFHCTLGS